MALSVLCFELRNSSVAIDSRVTAHATATGGGFCPFRGLGSAHIKSTQSGGPGYYPECLNVIPSEVEESKPMVGSRGAIHVTRPRIEARCSATAWL